MMESSNDVNITENKVRYYIITASEKWPHLETGEVTLAVCVA